MRIRKAGMILLAALLLLLGGETARAAEAGDIQDEWTVLFYMCGSDLESKYAYATSDLEELADVMAPEKSYIITAAGQGREAVADTAEDKLQVNVLIETGGCSKWHSDNLGIAIQEKALQRWRLTPRSALEPSYLDGGESSFELMETLPLASMAEGKTLTDFIKWGVQTCPAKKYALVLWDHGGGAKTGLFIDELFEEDVMYLDELKQALENSGTKLETILMDACLMSNIETAWAVKDSARWLVASEEVVPGRGTAMQMWLQELIRNPGCDGKQLGRVICDTTQILYSNQDDASARSMLTWSVIDLKEAERLALLGDKLFQRFGEAYLEQPWMTFIYAKAFQEAEEYGDGSQEMRDIAGVIYHPNLYTFLDRELRNELIEAFSATVVYSVRGTGRSAARGLSFCYATHFTPEELDIYARNCPSPHYLAFLDALTEWTAPDSVYETAARLPKLDTVEDMRMNVRRIMTADGIPGVTLSGLTNLTGSIYYRLYRYDEETGQTVLLGRTPCVFSMDEDVNVLWYANDPMIWPTIDGIPCDIELVQEYAQPGGTSVEYLYNIPVQIGTENSFLRCGRMVDYTDDGVNTSSYQVYGVWQGYEEHSAMTNRNVKSLAQLMGQDYRIIYPVDPPGPGGRRVYQMSRNLTMYRALSVKEKPLPAGIYYLEYEVDDMFLRPTMLERIEMRWDGTNLTFPEGDAWAE